MKLIKALSTVIAIVGLLVFAVGGKFVVTNMLNKENKIATKAIVEATFSFSNDGKNKLAWISYEVNGEKHNASLSNESNRFRNGQEIDIYYHKDDINRILSKDSEDEMIRFFATGLVLFIIGMIGIDYCIRKEKRIKRLRETGEMIEATYLETVFNRYKVIDGRYPYHILCGWIDPETNVQYIFKSGYILFNPEQVIKEKDITKIPVYINMKRKGEYLVDITEITGETVEINSL